MNSKKIRRELRRAMAIEPMERRDLMAADWQNASQKLDANHDLVVSPLDALIGINRLNRDGSGELPTRAKGSQEPYFDTDGNGRHTPLDVLFVINALNIGKPLPAVRLQNDTGVGPESIQDRMTTDASIIGRVSIGKASSLQARFSSDSIWHDVTTWLDAEGGIQASESELEALLGTTFENGSYELQFRVVATGEGENGVGDADLSYSFSIDASPPYVDLISPWIVSQGDDLRVEFNERIDAGSLDRTKVRLVAIPSEADIVDLSSVITIPTSSVEVSDDGYGLIIRPQTSLLNGRYGILLINNAIRDMAGNGELTGNPNETTIVHFNRFIANETLLFDKFYTLDSSQQSSPKEYGFDGQVGQQFVLDATFLSTAGSSLRLFAPSGEQTSFVNGTNFFTLEETGRYVLRVFVMPNFPIEFVMYSMANAIDISKVDEIQDTVLNTDDFYRFQSVPGEKWYFEATGPTATNALKIISPFITSQEGIVRKQELGNDFSIVFQDQGEVWLQGSGAYQYRIHRSEVITETLAKGTWVEGSIAVPGQSRTYTLEASAGDIFLIEQDPLGELMPPKIEIRTPFGLGSVAESIGVRTWIAPIDGSYTFSLSAIADSTPNYRFRISKALDNTLQFDTLFGLGDSPLSFLRFDLDTDRRLVFKSNSNDNAGRWSLLRQIDNRFLEVWDEVLSTSSQHDLKAGSYLLLLKGNELETELLWTVLKPSTLISTLEPGDYSLHLNEGDVAEYRLSATVGARYLLAQANSNEPLMVTFSSTDNTYTWTFDNSALPILIPESGDYVLRVETIDGKPANVALTWITLSDAAQVLPDTTVSGTLDSAKGIAYQIKPVNKRLYLHSENPVADANWIVYDHLLRPVAESSMADDIDLLLPNNSQLYLVLQLLEGNSSESYQFQQFNPVDASREAILGLPINGQLAHRGDRITYTFDAVAGQLIYLDNRTLGSDIDFQWIDRQSNDQQSIPVENGNRSWLIRESGKYSIQIENLTGVSSTFKFQLIDLDPSQLLNIGSVNSISLPTGSSTSAYRIQPNSQSQIELNFQFSDGAKVDVDVISDGEIIERFEIDTASSVFELLNLPISSRPIYFVLRRNDLLDVLSNLDLVANQVSDSVVPQGFGVIYEGSTIANQETIIPLYAPAGSWMQLDGMYSSILEYSNVAIYGPNDELLYEGTSNSDSSLIFAPSSGDYEIRLTKFGEASKYKFRMNLSTLAPSIQLGDTVDNQSQPENSISLHQLNLDQPTEVFLHASRDWLVNVLSVIDGATIESATGFEGLKSVYLTAGTHLISFARVFADSGVSTLRLESIQQVETISLDQLTDVSLVEGKWKILKFQLPPGETILAPRVTGLGEYAIFRPSQGFIWSNLSNEPDRNFSQPGEYRLILKPVEFSQDHIVKVEISHASSTSIAARVETDYNRLIRKAGDSFTFNVPVTLGQNLSFDPQTNHNFFDVRMSWIDADGSEVELKDERLPVYSSGVYRLKFTALVDNTRIQFRITDFDQLEVASSDLLEGTVPAAKYSKRWLLTGTPGELIAINTPQVGVQEYEASLVDESGRSTRVTLNFGKTFFKMPETGRAMLVVGRSTVAGDFDYSLKIHRLASSPAQLPFDQNIIGDFAFVGEVKRFAFQAKRGDEIWIKSADELLSWELETPSGNNVSPLQHYRFLEDGKFVLALTNERAQTAFQFRVMTSPEQLPVLPLAQPVDIVVDQKYELPLLVAGKYKITVLSSQGTSDPANFFLTDALGNVTSSQETFTVVHPSSLILTANPRSPVPVGTTWKIQVDPIEILSRMLAVGDRVESTISLNNLQEEWIEIPVSAGQWLQFDQVHADPNVRITFDFPFASWRAQGGLTIPTPYFSDHQGKLRVHVQGQGTFGFTVKELGTPPLVSPGVPVEGSMKGNEVRVWTLDTHKGESYVLKPNQSIPHLGQWWIVNQSGTIVRFSDWNQPISFTTSNDGVLKLFMIGQEDTTKSLDFEWTLTVR